MTLTECIRERPDYVWPYVLRGSLFAQENNDRGRRGRFPHGLGHEEGRPGPPRRSGQPGRAGLPAQATPPCGPGLQGRGRSSSQSCTTPTSTWPRLMKQQNNLDRAVEEMDRAIERAAGASEPVPTAGAVPPAAQGTAGGDGRRSGGDPAGSERPVADPGRGSAGARYDPLRGGQARGGPGGRRRGNGRLPGRPAAHFLRAERGGCEDFPGAVAEYDRYIVPLARPPSAEVFYRRALARGEGRDYAGVIYDRPRPLSVKGTPGSTPPAGGPTWRSPRSSWPCGISRRPPRPTRPARKGTRLRVCPGEARRSGARGRPTLARPSSASR